jgi:hypothetical protein
VSTTDKIRIGGLMRCCIATIDILYDENPGMAVTEGQTLQCRYAPENPDHRIRFRDGAWEWDRD